MWYCYRELWEGGSTAIPNGPYSPAAGLPVTVRKKHPQSVTLFYNDAPEHPAMFVAFGGPGGARSVVRHALGAPVSVTYDTGKRLVNQIDRFLHANDKRAFKTVKQAAGRLRAYWTFLQFADANALQLQDQALDVLLSIIDGSLVGFDAEFALHSLAGYLNQYLSDALNLNKESAGARPAA